jgi:threonine dehydrogenase-like Zn-dependent dehydrogenase
MTSSMSALVFRAPGLMEIEQRPRPSPGAGEVLVEVGAVGICGSELTSFTGASTRRPPGRVFGHEVAGVVKGVGPGVAEELLGAAVAVNPLHACGRCRQCLAGRSNACPHRTLLGMQVDGGFAEEVAVAASLISPLGALDDVAGSLVEPIANAVHVAGLLPSVLGRHVAVLGAGAIGLSVVSVLRLAGASKITVVDPVEARRREAVLTGADVTLAPDELGGEGLVADHVVDAAGATSSRNAAIEICDSGGTIVLLGLHTAVSEMPINAAVAKELRLQCSYAYTAMDFDASLTMLQAGAIPYQSWISERPLADGHAAFETLVERPHEATKIILRPARG